GDGNVWFTDNNGNAPSIGVITPTGGISTFLLPRLSDPEGITPGTDGNLYFTNTQPVKGIYSITPAGIIDQNTNPLVSEAFGIAPAVQNVAVSGLSITGFNGAGIVLLPGPNDDSGAVGDKISGNFIGTVTNNHIDPNRAPEYIRSVGFGPNHVPINSLANGAG